MEIRWFGQSAFLLSHDGAAIAIDPFGDLAAQMGSEMRFYPPVDCSADLLLITHEHPDHNAAERVAGATDVVRSTAGRFQTGLGEVVAVASEHDAVAGTERGPNAILVFPFGGLRFAHLGDFGQPALRPEQHKAIGEVDVLFLPAGGGPTTGGAAAAAIARALSPSLVIPMHYRTEAIDFLDPPDELLDALGWEVTRAGTSAVTVERPLERRVLLLAPPG